jgi:hypothetical protein
VRLSAPYRRGSLFHSDEAFFVIGELPFDPVESLDDFVKTPMHFFKAPVNIVLEIVESLVLGPPSNPLDWTHKLRQAA